MHEEVEHQSYRTFSVSRDVEGRRNGERKKEDSNELIATKDLCDHSHNGDLHTENHITSVNIVWRSPIMSFLSVKMHEDAQHQSYANFSVPQDIEKKKERRKKKESSN